MSAFAFERRKRYLREVNIISLVDVLFLLLMFFMLTSSFMTNQALQLSLPSTGGEISPQEKPLTLVVGDRGRLFLDNKAVAIADLQGQLQAQLQENPARRVIIINSGQVTVQELVSAMDTVARAGGTNVSLSNWNY